MVKAAAGAALFHSATPLLLPVVCDPAANDSDNARKFHKPGMRRRMFVAFSPWFGPGVTELTEDIPEFSVHYFLMLNEKQFRDRAIRELREIGKLVQSLSTDRDLYQNLESKVISGNPQLANTSNPYLPMLRAAYTDAATMRLRRLFAPDANLSLRRLLAQMPEYPDMLHDKLTGKELSADLAELDRMGMFLKEHIDPHFAGHERTPAAVAASNRELDRAIDFLVDCVKRYYWIVSDSYIEVEPAYAEDPLAVFRFPWMLSK